MSDLHIPYQVEPRHHYTNTDNRPDITIFDIETGQTLDLDISLAHPWSVDNVKRASRIDGFAASAREDKKKAKYSEHQLPGVVSPNVSLLCSNILVVGVRKLLDSSTNCLGKTIMCCSSRVTGENDFSIILQKCNARVLLKKLSRLSCDNIVADDLFDFDIQYQFLYRVEGLVAFRCVCSHVECL